MLRRALFAMAAALIGAPAIATTIYVNGATGNDAWTGLCAEWDGGTCGPKATIQAGIDAASTGDEVIVADGTYRGAGNKDLELYDKVITLRSADRDPTRCVLDCEKAGRGMYIHGAHTAAGLIEGFTIINGYPAFYGPGGGCGGGILCQVSEPTIRNCIIRGSIARADFALGGGVACTSANATLDRCVISGNAVSGINLVCGGGVGCESSQV